jgi:GNAT superfamily N-acetyltransferase
MDPQPYSTLIAEAAGGVLRRPKHTIGLIAELNGRIVGAASAHAGEYLIGEGAILVSVELVAVEQEKLPAVRRAKTFAALIQGLRRWAKSRNARALLLHVTTGTNVKATDRLLRAAGMKCVGGSYVG